MRILKVIAHIAIDDDADDLEQARETVDRIFSSQFPSGQFGGIAELESVEVSEVAVPHCDLCAGNDVDRMESFSLCNDCNEEMNGGHRASMAANLGQSARGEE